MRERSIRIQSLRLTSTQLAALLEVSEERLRGWVDGDLRVEDADVIEVGISLLEGVRRYQNDETSRMPLLSVLAEASCSGSLN